jgi:hypothetical protein
MFSVYGGYDNVDVTRNFRSMKDAMNFANNMDAKFTYVLLYSFNGKDFKEILVRSNFLLKGEKLNVIKKYCDWI